MFELLKDAATLGWIVASIGAGCALAHGLVAAACIGALLPLSLNLAAELRVPRRESTRGA